MYWVPALPSDKRYHIITRAHLHSIGDRSSQKMFSKQDLQYRKGFPTAEGNCLDVPRIIAGNQDFSGCRSEKIIRAFAHSYSEFMLEGSGDFIFCWTSQS